MSKDRDCETSPCNLFYCLSRLITKDFLSSSWLTWRLSIGPTPVFNIFLVLLDPKLDIAFQMQYNKCWVKGNYHFLSSAGYRTFNIALDAVSLQHCQGTDSSWSIPSACQDTCEWQININYFPQVGAICKYDEAAHHPLLQVTDKNTSPGFQCQEFHAVFAYFHSPVCKF